jgi:hypothetical protein
MANVKPKKQTSFDVIETLNPKTLGQEDTSKLFAEFEEEGDAGQRVIKIGDFSFRLRIKNPYNLWEVVTEGGPVPTELRGTFTNKAAAENALKRYVARKSNEGKIAKEYHEELVKKGFEPSPKASTFKESN